MPSDFGDIAAYHLEEAARHRALAQAALDRESFGEAEYHTSLAVRWEEVAREQKMEMRQEPAPFVAPRRWPQEPGPPVPLAGARSREQMQGRRAHAQSKESGTVLKEKPLEDVASGHSYAGFAVAVLRAVLRMGPAIRQSLPKRTAPVEGLTLR